MAHDLTDVSRATLALTVELIKQLTASGHLSEGDALSIFNNAATGLMNAPTPQPGAVEVLTTIMRGRSQ